MYFSGPVFADQRKNLDFLISGIHRGFFYIFCLMSMYFTGVWLPNQQGVMFYSHQPVDALVGVW